MSQLRMMNDCLKAVDEHRKEGVTVINSMDPAFTPEEFALEWAKISEELNQRFDPALYKRFMLDDAKVLTDSIFFVKTKEGELISTAALRSSEDPETVCLHRVGTRPDAKGKGGGYTVSAHCVNVAFEKGYRKMSLVTDEFRVPAIKIYYRLGFLPVFHEPDMRGRWESTARMIGYKEMEVINENGEHEMLSL